MNATRNTIGFNYTEALRFLCRDICKKVKEFRNVDVERIGYSFNIARNKDSRYGRWASMTPLRFEGGSLVTFKERKFYSRDSKSQRLVSYVQRQYFKCQTVCAANSTIPLLYIFNVMAPRFMDELSLREKIETVMHELYHIHPRFNGDVRRFPGRNWQHGSKAEYEAKSRSLADEWLAFDPNPQVYDFLKYKVYDFHEKFGGLYGSKFSNIPLIPIQEEEAFKLDHRLKTSRHNKE